MRFFLAMVAFLVSLPLLGGVLLFWVIVVWNVMTQGIEFLSMIGWGMSAAVAAATAFGLLFGLLGSLLINPKNEAPA